MTFISVTRLHLSSPLYFVPFMVSTLQIVRQIKRSPGFRGGTVGNDPQNGSWTLSMWEDMEAMRAFRNTGAHMVAMPRLLRWCDEASFAHWMIDADGTKDTNTLPAAAEAYDRLRQEGKLSKVRQPSALHQNGHTVSADAPRFRLQLKPRSSS